MAQEQQQGRVARESTEGRQAEAVEWFARDGVPMVKISCSASELIPTVQYGNVLCGPISVQRFVVDNDDLAKELQTTQALCEAAVAEERQTIQILMRSRIAGGENIAK